jgi:hypothetical protein
MLGGRRCVLGLMLVLVVGLVLAPTVALAVPPCVVSGVVTSASTGVPIPFAHVEVYHGVSYIGDATADFRGRYSIALPSDSYSFEVAAPGWTPISQGIVVPPAPALTLNFQLAFRSSQRVYRFFNTSTGTHFYSASDAEFINVYGTLANVFHYDGVVYSVDIAPPYPTKPLYRFFNFKNGVHFYTANEAERANVQANLSDRYRYEGVAYRVNTDSHGIPIHRFYAPARNAHFYTANMAEIDASLSKVYHYEGVGYYVGF